MSKMLLFTLKNTSQNSVGGQTRDKFSEINDNKKSFDKKRIKPQHYLTPENKGFTGILVVFYVFYITALFSHAESTFRRRSYYLQI